MKRTFKKMIMVLMSILLLVALVGCQNDTTVEEPSQPEGNGEVTEKANEDITINFIAKFLGNNYWQQAKLGAEAAGKDLGIKVNVLSPITAGSNDEQVSLIEQSLAQGVDAICLSPNDSKAIVPACNSIMDAGVPLVNMATKIDEDAFDLYLGVENFKLGNQVANELVNMGNGEGIAIVIEGPLGQQNSIDRADGAVAAFEDAGIEIVARQTANWQRTEALTLVQNLLQVNPDVKYIFACNDEMALGAYEAVSQAGMTEGVLISGIDASPEAIQAVADGKLAATLDQDSFGQAYKSIEYALEFVKGGDPEDEMMGGIVVTAENVGDYLK